MTDKRSKLVLGLFLVSAIVVLALSLYTGFSLNSFIDSLEQSRSQRLLAEAQASSLIVSPEELDAITDEESLSSEQGQVLERRLNAFAALHKLTDITYVRQLPSGEVQYIVSSTSSEGSYDVSTAPFVADDMIEQAFAGSIVVTDLQDSEGSAQGFMAYSPVFDADGAVVAVAAVGIDDGATLHANNMIRNLTVMLLVCIAIVILTACANVLLQVRKEHELQESVRVQKLMIEISQNLASEQPFENRVNQTLSILGNYLGASRAYILNISETDLANSLRHHWSKDNRDPAEDRDDAFALWQTMRNVFAAGEAEQQSVVSSANVSQSHERRFAHLKDAQSEAFIWAPLIVQNETWGVLALDFTKAQAEFLEKDIQLVESATSGLVGSIARELYNEQRELALDHAVHASEAKSEFLSNMSHEMRTPMNAIIGMTSIALSSDDTERKDYCLEHIKDASAHLLTIINDILDMSSLQSDELSLKNEPFSIHKALDNALKEYRHRIDEHDQIFTLTVDEKVPALLVGDGPRLSKVLSNLISNANKFTHDGGSIEVRVEHRGETAEGHNLYFEVKDNGIGVDPAIKDTLFGSFEQAEKGSNRKYGGTGLGLAISLRLVQLMQGQIGMESTVNEGSTFYFTVTLEEHIPQDLDQTSLELNGQTNGLGTGHFDAAAVTLGLAEATPQPNGSSAQDTPSSETKGAQSSEEPTKTTDTGIPDLSAYRILLAEDIEINREVVLALLADSGIQIDIAVNGIEVLDAIKNDEEGYDLVFMDLQMPEMDGLDATRRIRALPIPLATQLPIIAMTANVFQEDIDACLEAGMNDHIGKPISLDAIYRVLQTYLPEKA